MPPAWPVPSENIMIFFGISAPSYLRPVCFSNNIIGESPRERSGLFRKRSATNSDRLFRTCPDATASSKSANRPTIPPILARGYRPCGQPPQGGPMVATVLVDADVGRGRVHGWPPALSPTRRTGRAPLLRDNLDENGATIWMRRGG